MRNGNANQRYGTRTATAAVVAFLNKITYSSSRPVKHGQSSTPGQKALCESRVSVRVTWYLLSYTWYFSIRYQTWYPVYVPVCHRQFVLVARFGEYLVDTLWESVDGRCFVTVVLWWFALASRHFARVGC